MRPFKLTDKAKEFVFEKYVENQSLPAIAKEIKHAFGIVVNPETVSRLIHNPENKIFIDKYREKYLANIRAVPIANKRVRLDDLEAMRSKLIKKLEQIKIKDVGGLKTYLFTAKRFLEVINGARMEMEDKPQFINNIVINELSDLTDNELVIRERELLTRLNASRVPRLTEDTEGEEIEAPE